MAADSESHEGVAPHPGPAEPSPLAQLVPCAWRSTEARRASDATAPAPASYSTPRPLAVQSRRARAHQTFPANADAVTLPPRVSWLQPSGPEPTPLGLHYYRVASKDGLCDGPSGRAKRQPQRPERHPPSPTETSSPTVAWPASQRPGHFCALHAFSPRSIRPASGHERRAISLATRSDGCAKVSTAVARAHKASSNSTSSVSFRSLHSSADKLAWNDAKTVHLPCKRCQVLYFWKRSSRERKHASLAHCDSLNSYHATLRSIRSRTQHFAPSRAHQARPIPGTPSLVARRRVIVVDVSTPARGRLLRPLTEAYTVLSSPNVHA